MSFKLPAPGRRGKLPGWLESIGTLLGIASIAFAGVIWLQNNLAGYLESDPIHEDLPESGWQTLCTTYAPCGTGKRLTDRGSYVALLYRPMSGLIWSDDAWEFQTVIKVPEFNGLNERSYRVDFMFLNELTGEQYRHRATGQFENGILTVPEAHAEHRRRLLELWSNNHWVVPIVHRGGRPIPGPRIDLSRSAVAIAQAVAMCTIVRASA